MYIRPWCLGRFNNPLTTWEEWFRDQEWRVNPSFLATAVVTSVADSESQAAQKDGYWWLLAVTGGYWRTSVASESQAAQKEKVDCSASTTRVAAKRK